MVGIVADSGLLERALMPMAFRQKAYGVRTSPFGAFLLDIAQGVFVAEMGGGARRRIQDFDKHDFRLLFKNLCFFMSIPLHYNRAVVILDQETAA